MGRKVHPIGFRLKINKTWDGRWYAEGDEYVNQLHQDFKIRDFIREAADRAGISRIEIERFPGNVRIFVHSSRPGVLIGRQGSSIKLLRSQIEALAGKKIDIQIKEIKEPDLDAFLVARSIQDQIERRISYRRAMRRALQNIMRAGAEGAKIEVAGRLGGADMARRVWVREGRVPLHTLRADIDYASHKAITTYSAVGIKVWIYKGEVIPETEDKVEASEGVYVSK
jgi:small subunit ribosomal protein S3